MAGTTRRAPSVAVGTHHLALVDLRPNGLPRTGRTGHGAGDVESLVFAGEVVELEDDEIGLSAVHAGMRTQVVDDAVEVALPMQLLQFVASLAGDRHGLTVEEATDIRSGESARPLVGRLPGHPRFRRSQALPSAVRRA
ncbi:hypothetical protein [Microbacterium stercoris]|uniref:Uncharacterized protein n=1 Tax=Microbacterium stercoris TaxID=2820289 RepID=A0A939QSV0_9MICO|nr:hypothetical protein [Microbacterium stercoris]MBO3664031.1 hypothetical protein [Microbacterium stercoris]